MSETSKIIEVVNSLKHTYDVNVLDLVEDYSQNMTLQEMSSKYSCTIHTVLVILTTLALRRKRKHRALDYMVFKKQLTDAKQSPDKVENKMFNSELELNELRHQVEVKDRALIKTRVELNTLRHNRRKSVKSEVTASDLLTKFDLALGTIKGVPKYIQTVPLNEDLLDEGLVVLYGDQHYGDVVKSSEVPGNEYNYEIAKARLDKYIDSILMYPLQSNNITVVNLNDMIKGVIHGGVYATEGGFIESLVQAVDINVYFFSILAATYDTVRVISTGDNHARIHENIPTSNKNRDSYSVLIDKMTAKMLKSAGINNVEIYSSESALQMFEVNGASIVCLHGDTLRKFNVFDGGQRALLQDHCLTAFGKTYKHSFNGHSHIACQCTNQYGGMSITNGTLLGQNDYGVNNGFRPIQASQTICFVNLDGNIEDTKTVNLQDA